MSQSVKKVAILGSAGFTGLELLRLLERHPYVEVDYVSSSAYVKKTVAQVFPQFDSPKTRKMVFQNHPQSVEELQGIDAVFLATPDEVALEWVPKLLDTKIFCVDISGAYRLTPDNFHKAHRQNHPHPKAIEQCIYGLSEVYRDRISQAQVIANPGCYVTSTLLPLYAMKDFASYFADTIVIDAKSGTSGAGGRKEKDSMGYSTVYENYKAYKIEQHQHTPEMAQYGESFFQKPLRLRFTPQLLPMFRGILNCTYLYVNENFTVAVYEQLRQKCRDFAAQETFIRFYEDPNAVELRNIQYTNYLDFAMYFDEQSRILQVVSALDNLTKGAAGQALQNFNIRMGFEESLGLV